MDFTFNVLKMFDQNKHSPTLSVGCYKEQYPPQLLKVPSCFGLNIIRSLFYHPRMITCEKMLLKELGSSTGMVEMEEMAFLQHLLLALVLTIQVPFINFQTLSLASVLSRGKALYADENK